MLLHLVNPSPEGIPPQSVCGKFGARRDPMLPCRWWVDDPNGRRHVGIDVAGPYRSPILAPADGFVQRAYWSTGGGGWVIWTRHYVAGRTLYAGQMHMAYRSFQVDGDPVSAGERIGLMGSTGSSLAVHNHTVLCWDQPGYALPYWSDLFIDPEPIYFPTEGEEENMRRGDQGARVRWAQKRLNYHITDMPPITEDGDFGPATEDRVKVFQSRHKSLDQDGVLTAVEVVALDKRRST